jgi:hypothetical protein
LVAIESSGEVPAANLSSFEELVAIAKNLYYGFPKRLLNELDTTANKRAVKDATGTTIRAASWLTDSQVRTDF